MLKLYHSLFLMLFMSEPKYAPRNAFPIFLKLHKTAEFITIVPYVESSSHRLAKVLMDSDVFYYWCFSLFASVIMRILISLLLPLVDSNLNALTRIPFNTLGLFFATTSAGTIRSKSDQFIVSTIAIGSIFTGIFCSGVLLQTFIGSATVPFFNSMLDVEKIPIKYKSNMFVLFNIMAENVE